MYLFFKFQMSDPVNLNKPIQQADHVVAARAIAKTSDSRTTHFGERISSTREMCKRYTSMGRYLAALPTAGNLADITAGRRPIIVPIPVFADVSVAGSSQVTPGFLGTMSSMYRLFRGPMCFKIKVTGVDYSKQPTRGWVTFVPYGPASLVSALPDSIITLVTEVPFYNPGTFSAETNCIPFAYFSDSQTAEFEVPYTNHNAAALQINAFDQITTATINDYSYYNLLAYIYADKIDANSKVYLDVQYAFGDETHFGSFLGVPQCKINTGIVPNNFN